MMLATVLLGVGATAASASIDVVYSESGKLTLSVDALGTNAASGVIQADKPAGATVRQAYLVAASTGVSGYTPPDGEVTIDGAPVAWDPSKTTNNSILSVNVLADVTSMVKPKLDAAPAGRVDFVVTENNSTLMDGEILAVVFNDPAATTNTVALLYGAQQTTGDRFAIGLADPVDKSKPGFAMNLSLGISFGFQPAGQFSQVDVNGQRLTTSAGGQDDGDGGNGTLITAGGLDDSTANPTDPNGTENFCGAAPRCDDELYDLVPLVSNGATSVDVDTLNPSNDDNVFFAALDLRNAVAVIGEGVVLAPDGTSKPVGQDHTLTATVQNDDGDPVAGRTVTFKVVSGPNAGVTGNAVTGPDGKATFTYTSATAGTDEIVAEFQDSTGQTRTSNPVRHTWTSVTPVKQDTRLTAEPVLARVLTPQTKVYLTFEARLTTTGGVPVSGKPITFSVRGRPACTATTNSAGVARCGSLVNVIDATLALGYTARFAGDETHTAASANGSLIIIGSLKVF